MTFLIISQILNGLATGMLYALLAVGLTLILGVLNIPNFAHGALYAFGAYACGLMLNAGVPLFLAIPAGTGLALIVAAMVGYFCVKRTGLYFICLTFGFNQMFYFIAYVWTEVTGGEDGLVVIPRPNLISDSASFYVFIALLFFACLLAMLKIVSSPLGLVFRLIRKNPSRAAAVGYNVRLFKWFAFIIASAFTALAGTVYAMLYSIVPIDQIHWLKSGDFIFMLLFGGVGNFFGPLIGAVGYILLSETFAIFWSRWPLLMGGVFIVVVLYLRGGIVELIEKVCRLFVSKDKENMEAVT